MAIAYNTTFTTLPDPAPRGLSVSTNLIDTIQLTSPQGSQMHTFVKTVKTKAGWLGQVVLHDPQHTIVWESRPKRSVAKATRAAEAAQVRAMKKVFSR